VAGGDPVVPPWPVVGPKPPIVPRREVSVRASDRSHGGWDPRSTRVLGCACGVTTAVSAVAESSAVIRSAGSLTSMAVSSGSSAPESTGGRGSSSTTAVTSARWLSRSKGLHPSTAKYSGHPSENRSAAAVGGPPVARSGAR
jgi:hypothetical protein